MTTTTYTVNGMTCGHCVSSVTAEIDAINGVQSVVVDLSSGQVTVTSDQPLSERQVANAVEEAGYELATSVNAN